MAVTESSHDDRSAAPALQFLNLQQGKGFIERPAVASHAIVSRYRGHALTREPFALTPRQRTQVNDGEWVQTQECGHCLLRVNVREAQYDVHPHARGALGQSIHRSLLVLSDGCRRGEDDQRVAPPSNQATPGGRRSIVKLRRRVLDTTARILGKACRPPTKNVADSSPGHPGTLGYVCGGDRSHGSAHSVMIP